MTSVRRGAATLATALLLFPLAAFAEAEIHIPIGAPTVSQTSSSEGDLVLLEGIG
jgi:hypothetical protein